LCVSRSKRRKYNYLLCSVNSVLIFLSLVFNLPLNLLWRPPVNCLTFYWFVHLCLSAVYPEEEILCLCPINLFSSLFAVIIIFKMSSSSLIRIQQSSLINLNNNKRHTISIIRLFFHLFKYIYLLNRKLFLYLFYLIKCLLKILLTCWIYVYVGLSGSRKKVNRIFIIKKTFVLIR